MEIESNPRLSIMSVESNDKIEDLRRLFENSDRVVSPSSTPAPSLKKYWLMAFIENYGRSRQWSIVSVLRDGIPRLIMPVQEMEDGSLEFLCDETSDYNDFLVDQPDLEVLGYGLEYWVSRGIRKITLNRVPADSKTVALLSQISAARGWGISVSRHEPIPVVFAEPGKDIHEWTGVKRDRVKRYERKLSALSKLSRVSFSLVETKSKLLEEFPAIAKLHIARWQALGMRSKYSDERRTSFILSVCERAIEEQSLFMPLMKVDEVLASFIIGFRGGNTIFDWNTSFATDFWNWSPGALLLLHVLSNPCKYGFDVYNLMRGAENYKFTWTDKCEFNLRIRMEIP